MLFSFLDESESGKECWMRRHLNHNHHLSTEEPRKLPDYKWSQHSDSFIFLPHSHLSSRFLDFVLSFLMSDSSSFSTDFFVLYFTRSIHLRSNISNSDGITGGGMIWCRAESTFYWYILVHQTSERNVDFIIN